MKFKFVKKGKEISSEEVSRLMNFEQLADKAAGMGSAPLAKGGIASKSAFMGKALWLAAMPFVAAVYLTVVELSYETPPDLPEVTTPPVLITEEEPVMVDSTDMEQEASPVATTQPTSKKEASAARTEEKEEKPTKAEETSEEILIKEDIVIKAEPINGFPAFYETIDRELTYPESARISGLEGIVRIYFVVDEQGMAGRFQVVQSLGEHFDEEALRVMKKLTEWKPAMHNGQPVSSHLSIKLRFQLEKE